VFIDIGAPKFYEVVLAFTKGSHKSELTITI